MSWKRRALLTLLPIGLLLAAAGAAALALPSERLPAVGGLALLTFAAGRFLALAPVAYDGVTFSPVFIAGVVITIEAVIALFVSVNLDVLYRLPRIGAVLHSVEEAGKTTLARHPWIRRMTWTGIVAFLSLPLPSTGPVGGTVISRLAGLGMVRSFTAVMAGNAIGVYALALTAHGVINWVAPQQEGVISGAAKLAAIVAVIALLTWLWNRRVKSSRT